MTIEEKAKNFASEFSSQRSLIYGFEKGAEWMLEKAVERFTDEIKDFEALLLFVNKKAAGLIDKEKTIEKFRKAKEE